MTVLLWGFNFVSVKLVYAQLTAPALCLVWYLLMWLALLLVCVVIRKPVTVDRADRWRVWGAGFVSMGAYMILFLEGMRLTSPAEGAILLSSSPLLTYVFSVGTKLEKFTAAGAFGTAIAFFGVIAVILGGSGAVQGSLFGNVLVFTSAVVWALSTMQMRPLVNRYDPLTVFTASLPGALPLLLPYGIRATTATPWTELTASTWLNLAQITLGSGTIAFICFYEGVKQIGPAVATRYQFFVPIVAAISSWFVFGRTLVGVQWLGIFGVIGGVAVTTWARSQPKASRLNSPTSEA